MDLRRCFLVQDRETCSFVGKGVDGELDLVPYLNKATRFDNAEEATLNGLCLCGEGYVLFFCYVEVEEFQEVPL